VGDVCPLQRPCVGSEGTETIVGRTERSSVVSVAVLASFALLAAGFLLLLSARPAAAQTDTVTASASDTVEAPPTTEAPTTVPSTTAPPRSTLPSTTSPPTTVRAIPPTTVQVGAVTTVTRFGSFCGFVPGAIIDIEINEEPFSREELVGKVKLVDRLQKMNHALAGWVSELQVTSQLLVKLGAGLSVAVAAAVGILQLFGLV